jgi:uncharacterized repeat protein (TIGR01451 family)
MKKFLLLQFLVLFFIRDGFAQPATFGIPLSIGRNNCGTGTDSMYFFDYANANLSRAVYPNGYRPRLKIGPASTTDRFTITLASISFNPKDQKLYYLWTVYPTATTAITYVWRWKPDTTFAAGVQPATAYLDTLRSFPYDIGGVAFDNNGVGWTLEFPPAPCRRAFLRPIDFAAGIYNSADTLDFTTGPGGIGDSLWSPGNGDITMMPSGQMYYNFDNKLYTPDYGSYGGSTHHLKSTYIDTTRRPTGATYLVGLAFADGDLIAAYSPSCYYRRLNPVTGDTNYVNYNYAAGKGVRSVDMTQINSGVGAAKKLISVIPTGTLNQYDVKYDVYVRNFGTIPVTNVQVSDNLSLINGLANVSNVSVTFTNNPAGLLLNPAYNGTTVLNILNAGQTLPNYPTSKNNFTVRITCRLSNILPGIIYNNQAVATANGFNNNPVRDSSTNGNNPDLNQNDKPDDLGESQPTPLLVTLTPTTPPCSVLSQVMYNQDFGTGNGMVATLPLAPTASTGFSGSTTIPLGINQFALSIGSQLPDPSNFVTLFDHTPLDVSGRMMVINADAAAKIIYTDTLPVSCPGQQYSLSYWSAFIGNPTYQTVCEGLGGFKYPLITARIRDVTTGLIITQFTSDTIKLTSWQQYGMKWVMPAGYSNVIMELINAGPGGCGNDFVLDDIQYGICDPLPTISISTAGVCLGASVTFTSALTDAAVIPGIKNYQWQTSPTATGPWTDIVPATSANYIINPVNASDTGKYYRVIVAAQGNILNPLCRYFSTGLKLTGYVPSAPALSVSKNKNNICPGIAVTLTQVGGTLGTNASWKWYTGASCGTTLAGTGPALVVTPAVTTTYYIRAEGDCNITSCMAVTVTINCNIDKDKDGIPDYVESNMTAAFADANGNGITNSYDPTFAGFIDNNNDFINDNFQADGDSDNDGIPNYQDATFPGRVDANADAVDDRFDTDLDGKINMLDIDSDNDGIPDVVEAYGADTNGDGKIDNYIDADGDGLSDNVDSRIFTADGAYNTGIGLGLPNLDGEAAPNFIDLDSDNDGIPDIVEAGAPDINNNGKVDGFADINGDGIHDGYLNITALLRTGTDINNDGRADSYPNKNLDRDFRPNAYDLDSDGDGITDVIEASLPDADLNGIVDGVIAANGWSTTVSVMPVLNLRNTDASGNPDYLDIDADNDGIPDNIEGMSTVGYLLPTTTDTDGDGLMAPYDNVVGYGGSGIFVYDHDSDGTPDYRDLDTDGDGSLDICEGNDWNLNGICDELLTLTGLDTDGDGLDNRFDSLNSVTNIKGTSYMMGNGGSSTGDATPGAKATVQKKTAAQINRDWRYVGVVLPVQFLGFTGKMQNTQVFLNWSIIAAIDIDRFEVERSTDNKLYTKVGTVTDPVQLNVPQNFLYPDVINEWTNDIVYYRLKVITTTGEVQYSNILALKQSSYKAAVTIMPNPANNYVYVNFLVKKESEVNIRLLDNTGKTVLLQKQKATKGNNTILLENLSQYNSGIYTLQLLINNEITSQKLVISR